MWRIPPTWRSHPCWTTICKTLAVTSSLLSAWDIIHVSLWYLCRQTFNRVENRKGVIPGKPPTEPTAQAMAAVSNMDLIALLWGGQLIHCNPAPVPFFLPVFWHSTSGWRQHGFGQWLDALCVSPTGHQRHAAPCMAGVAGVVCVLAMRSGAFIYFSTAEWLAC